MARQNYPPRKRASSSPRETGRLPIEKVASNRLNVKDALARLKQGNAKLNEGDIDRAIAQYDLALALDGLLVEAYRMRGIAYTKKGETDRAIANFRTVLYFFPEDEDAKERIKALGAVP